MFELNLKFQEFWPIIEIFLGIFAISLGIRLIYSGIDKGFDYLSKWLEKRRTKKWLEKHKTLEEWKKVGDKEFERITAAIFEKLGYKTKVVGGPGDRGIDVISYKGSKKIAIQCKKQDIVPPKDILALKGAINENEQGILATTGHFTKEGEEIDKEKSIELIDGLELEKLLAKSK